MHRERDVDIADIRARRVRWAERGYKGDVASEPSDVLLTVCPDGPFLLRGPAEIIGEDGRVIERTRGTVALCRCGLTGRPPWCDGSHKVVSRSRRRRSAASTAGLAVED